MKDGQKYTGCADTAMERGALYGLLAKVFRSEPTAEFLDALAQPEFEKLLELDLAAPTGDDLVDDLAVEYSALFLGPGGHISPYESVQAVDGGVLNSETTAAVRSYIEASGFQYDENFHGLADHISVELDFMAAIAGQEAEAWRQGDREKARNCLTFEKEFLDDHLGRWAGKFCTRILDQAVQPFYRRIAELTRDFIAAETGEIDQRLEAA